MKKLVTTCGLINEFKKKGNIKKLTWHWFALLIHPA